MIHDPQHTIKALAVRPPAGLTLTFADGHTLSVDLTCAIETHPALAALGDDALFASAHIDALGGYVVWNRTSWKWRLTTCAIWPLSSLAALAPNVC